MTITLTPEHEGIIQAQLASGQFHSVDEVLDRALAPLRTSVVPEFSEEERKAKARAAVERILELSKGVTLDRPAGMSLREYAHLGHKY
jgi:Arc/MetJ-type ribon-helix-helix transcriptional regulator